MLSVARKRTEHLNAAADSRMDMLDGGKRVEDDHDDSALKKHAAYHSGVSPTSAENANRTAISITAENASGLASMLKASLNPFVGSAMKVKEDK